MRGYKIALHKAYFEKGYALSHYLFKLIAVFGMTSQNIQSTFYALSVYTIACYFFGMFIYKSGFAKAEHEVSNQFNLLAIEIRDTIKNGKI